MELCRRDQTCSRHRSCRVARWGCKRPWEVSARQPRGLEEQRVGHGEAVPGVSRILVPNLPIREFTSPRGEWITVREW